MATMLAGVYHAKGDLRSEQVEAPLIGPADLLVKVARAGVCASDATYYKRGGEPWVTAGSIVGHEFVGTVHARGGEVPDSIQVGQRVFINPVTGAPAEKGGIIGAFAEYVPVRDAQLNHNVFLLPDSLSFADAVVLEPFCVALHGVHRAGLKPGDNAVVIGAGPIGLMAIAQLKHLGYDTVAGVVRRDASADAVAAVGGHAINTAQSDLRTALVDHFGSSETFLHDLAPNVDAYIDCAGAAGLPQQVLGLAKNNTRHVLVSAYLHDTTFDMAAMQRITCLNYEIRGSYTYTPEVILSAIAMLNAEDFSVSSVVTHELPLTQFSEAVRLAAEDDSSLKVVVNISDF